MNEEYTKDTEPRKRVKEQKRDNVRVARISWWAMSSSSLAGRYFSVSIVDDDDAISPPIYSVFKALNNN